MRNSKLVDSKQKACKKFTIRALKQGLREKQVAISHVTCCSKLAQHKTQKGI